MLFFLSLNTECNVFQRVRARARASKQASTHSICVCVLAGLVLYTAAADAACMRAWLLAWLRQITGSMAGCRFTH